MIHADPALQAMLQRARIPLSLPDSFQRVEQAVNAPASDARLIAAAVSQDQGMSSRVLRIANSPLYGFSTRIDTITRAVAIIGTRQIRDLALASTVIGLCDGMICPGINSKDYWLHAFAVGTLARNIASHNREPNPERYFLCGMLSTMGRLLLANLEPKTFSKIVLTDEESGDPFLHQREEAAFGFHQGALSSALLRRWLLPEVLCEPIAQQYAPRSSNALHRRPVAILHVAAITITTLPIGDCGERLALPLDPGAWDLCAIPTAQLPALCDNVEDIAANLCAIMEIP